MTLYSKNSPNNKPIAVEPLRARTMTLGKLQLATLDLIRHLRFQLNRQAHEEGTTDAEFLEQFVDPLETQIYQDRYVLRNQRRTKDAS